uniref:Uncharacterized protein n=1 Tax=Rhizophora mucronata TaxID=61149 RepID=A0A2P2N7Y6_RHIMU
MWIEGAVTHQLNYVIVARRQILNKFSNLIFVWIKKQIAPIQESTKLIR